MTVSGLNFRSTAGAVTDPANTFAPANDGCNYPTSALGTSIGFNPPQVYVFEDNGGWTAGNAPGLYGYAGHIYSAAAFRIDVTPGSYKVWIAMAGGYTGTCAIWDGDPAAGGTQRFAYNTFGAGSPAAWANGAVSTSTIDYTTAPFDTALISSGQLYITFGDGTGAYARLAHVAWEAVGGGGGSPTFSFTAPPSDTVSGATMSPVVVTSSDTADNTTVVTLAISGGTLGGTVSATMSAGVATFATLVPTGAGTGRTLHATASGYSAIDSATFTVSAAGGGGVAAGVRVRQLLHEGGGIMGRVIPRGTVDTALATFSLYLFDLETGEGVSGLAPFAVQKRINGASGVGVNATNMATDSGDGWYTGHLTGAESAIVEGGEILVTVEPAPAGIGIVPYPFQVAPAEVMAPPATVPEIQEGLATAADVQTKFDALFGQGGDLGTALISTLLHRAIAQEVFATFALLRGNKVVKDTVAHTVTTYAEDGVTILHVAPYTDAPPNTPSMASMGS